MTSDRRNELQEVSEWWNTTRNDSAWWHSIAKAIVKSGPVSSPYLYLPVNYLVGSILLGIDCRQDKKHKHNS